MRDLTTIEVSIGIGIILTLYLLVLWNYVRTNKKKEELYIKEIMQLSIEGAKTRDLLEKKDEEIVELKGGLR